MPSHDAAQEPSPGHGSLFGMGAPRTGEHLPTDPAATQVRHWPSQAESQQTPSAQNPDAHSPAAPQAMPGCDCGMQVWLNGSVSGPEET